MNVTLVPKKTSLGKKVYGTINPSIEELLKELIFNILVFGMIYCFRIRTRRGIYGQI